MGMPQGTGPEQLDLAVQADERTLQGGGTLEQNGRGQGAVTWNVLPTAMSSAVAAYMQNELHLGQAKCSVRAITISTQNCAQAGSCPQGGLGHINKHNSESSTLRTTSGVLSRKLVTHSLVHHPFTP